MEAFPPRPAHLASEMGPLGPSLPLPDQPGNSQTIAALQLGPGIGHIT